MHPNAQCATETPHWPAARVLVAEDDDELRWLIACALRKSGFDVIEAHDGTALLERAGEVMVQEHTIGGIDLIVSDIQMPGWSGLDVLAGLQHAGVQVPVVLITAFGDDKTHLQAARLGAVAVLDKPFDIERLRELVLASLQQKSRPDWGPLPGARRDAPEPRHTH